MAENWNKLDDKKAAKILLEVNKVTEPVPFNEDKTIIRKQELPFYENYDLYELTDMSTNPPSKKFALYGADNVKMINWKNKVVYDLNDSAPISLSEETIIPYVRFFFNYVFGRKGKFTIIENVEDIKWQIEPPIQGRKKMQEVLEAIKVTKKEKDNSFELEAYMTYKDSLFKANIKVAKNGEVEIEEEELKIEGMPLVQEVGNF